MEAGWLAFNESFETSTTAALALFRLVFTRSALEDTSLTCLNFSLADSLESSDCGEEPVSFGKCWAKRSADRPAPACDEGYLPFFFRRTRQLTAHKRPHIFRACLSVCISLFSQNPQSAFPFQDELLTVLWYNEPLLKPSEAPAPTLFCEGLTIDPVTSTDGGTPFCRLQVLLFLERSCAGTKTQDGEFEAWLTDMACKLMDVATGGPRNPMLRTRPYVLKLRAWQALSVVG